VSATGAQIEGAAMVRPEYGRERRVMSSMGAWWGRARRGATKAWQWAVGARRRHERSQQSHSEIRVRAVRIEYKSIASLLSLMLMCCHRGLRKGQLYNSSE